MNEIEYIQNVDIGGIFVGVGVLILSVVLAYWIYQLCRLWKGLVETELHYSIAEDTMLKQICKKKGIDLEKELLVREVLGEKRRTFRKEIQKEIFKQFFPEKN